MNPWLNQLEVVLRELLQAEQELLETVELHQQSVKAYDAVMIDRATRQQAMIAARVSALQQKRIQLATQIGRSMRMVQTPTITKLCELFPEKKLILMSLRDELKRIGKLVHERLQMTQQIVSATLGSVNQAVRVMAQAASGPATYSKTGATKMPTIVGTLDARG